MKRFSTSLLLAAALFSATLSAAALAKAEPDKAKLKTEVAAMEDAFAWRQGQVVFDGVPLKEALERFTHDYLPTIMLLPLRSPDPAVIECPTGKT